MGQKIIGYVLKPGTADRLKEFVKGGGQLLATYATGYVNENTLCWLGGFPGDGLNDLFGIISEELDTLYPSDENAAVFKDGTKGRIKDYAELLRIKDAEVLAAYESDYVKDTPAVTVKDYGDGQAYYVAARIDMESMSRLFRRMCEGSGMELNELPEGIEMHVRETESAKYCFYLNLTEEEKVVENVHGVNLINDEKIAGNLKLSRYEAAVVKR